MHMHSLWFRKRLSHGEVESEILLFYFNQNENVKMSAFG